MLQAVAERNVRNFVDDTMQRKTQQRLPRLCFHIGKSHDLVRDTSEVFYTLKSCQRLPSKRSDTERGQARSLRSETQAGHRQMEMQRLLLMAVHKGLRYGSDCDILTPIFQPTRNKKHEDDVAALED